MITRSYFIDSQTRCTVKILAEIKSYQNYCYKITKAIITKIKNYESGSNNNSNDEIKISKQ